jgi:hypothetical protein
LALNLLLQDAMKRLVILVGAFAAFAGLTYLFGASRWSLSFGVLAVGGAIWVAGRCAHSGPLGLLPPTFDQDGTRLPPRWFCPDCGAKWTATFDHDRRPVTRFAGYDEAKAVASAGRAREHDAQQRKLAMRRAGLGAPERPVLAAPQPFAPVLRLSASRPIASADRKSVQARPAS